MRLKLYLVSYRIQGIRACDEVEWDTLVATYTFAKAKHLAGASMQHVEVRELGEAHMGVLEGVLLSEEGGRAVLSNLAGLGRSRVEWVSE